MLDGIAPEQLAEWVAFRNLEPDRMDRIITILKLGLAAICWSLGNQAVEPDNFDPLPQHSRPESEFSPTQAAMAFSMFAGKAR